MWCTPCRPYFRPVERAGRTDASVADPESRVPAPESQPKPSTLLLSTGRVRPDHSTSTGVYVGRSGMSTPAKPLSTAACAAAGNGQVLVCGLSSAAALRMDAATGRK